MFDSLSDKLHGIFKKLRGESRLSESNISDAMREIRLALLEADVNLEVVTKFINDVRESCLGQEVLKSITPGQQMVRIVHDELVKLLGGGAHELVMKSRPSVIMLVGLHGFDEDGGFHQTFVSAGVQPCKALTQQDYVQFTLL